MSYERLTPTTAHTVNSDGIFDFLKLLEPLDPIHFDWRCKVGTFLAEKVEGRRRLRHNVATWI